MTGQPDLLRDPGASPTQILLDQPPTYREPSWITRWLPMWFMRRFTPEQAIILVGVVAAPVAVLVVFIAGPRATSAPYEPVPNAPATIPAEVLPTTGPGPTPAAEPKPIVRARAPAPQRVAPAPSAPPQATTATTTVTATPPPTTTVTSTPTSEPPSEPPIRLGGNQR